jgi:hypothetical protein
LTLVGACDDEMCPLGTHLVSTQCVLDAPLDLSITAPVDLTVPSGNYDLSNRD